MIPNCSILVMKLASSFKTMRRNSGRLESFGNGTFVWVSGVRDISLYFSVMFDGNELEVKDNVSCRFSGWSDVGISSKIYQLKGALDVEDILRAKKNKFWRLNFIS